MLVAYQEKKLSTDTLATIEQANTIIADYMSQGYKLTLRQLYYQFVARDLIPNTEKSYKRLGGIINDGRLCGLISWEAIEDRTRWLRTNAHWTDPKSILRSARDSYAIDMWDNQPLRLEVWIEKDALIGVIEGVCEDLDVPYFACKGYPSQSEVWAAGQRFSQYLEYGQGVVVLHLGDHDPSGIDMTRDIDDRFDMFCGAHTLEGKVEVRRLALNMEQIRKLKPPPNPAKLTDSRVESYMRRFGHSSWELDALEPAYIEKLVRSNILNLRDDERWEEAEQRLSADRAKLDGVVTKFKG